MPALTAPISALPARGGAGRVCVGLGVWLSVLLLHVALLWGCRSAHRR